ncbi:hypothetical protein BURPS1710A_4118 [Burkholderia pseudomallei 1710a]|uniref:Uncharacterized protein n=1 Tax=Burkholderia pseudomallei 1710a TaxID=320371 RepID=A0A0E1WEE2_BURPE|nr:hypothetical protein BURPS1710A_4118 [Burkholderia pseudomallei 1710a]
MAEPDARPIMTIGMRMRVCAEAGPVPTQLGCAVELVSVLERSLGF